MEFEVQRGTGVEAQYPPYICVPIDPRFSVWPVVVVAGAGKGPRRRRQVLQASAKQGTCDLRDSCSTRLPALRSSPCTCFLINKSSSFDWAHKKHDATRTHIRLSRDISCSHMVPVFFLLFSFPSFPCYRYPPVCACVYRVCDKVKQNG